MGKLKIKRWFGFIKCIPAQGVQGKKPVAACMKVGRVTDVCRVVEDGNGDIVISDPAG